MREDRSILDFIDADFTFVNERLARHYGIAGRQRRRVPPRRARRPAARRRADAGQRADGDLESDAHLAGEARQMGPGKPAGHAAPASAARRAAAQRSAGRGAVRLAARADGAAPRESRLRHLPQPHGPAGLRPGELRRHRRLADRRRQIQDRSLGHAARRPVVCRPAGAEGDPESPAGRFCPLPGRKDADLWLGPGGRVL